MHCADSFGTPSRSKRLNVPGAWLAAKRSMRSRTPRPRSIVYSDTSSAFRNALLERQWKRCKTTNRNRRATHCRRPFRSQCDPREHDVEGSFRFESGQRGTYAEVDPVREPKMRRRLRAMQIETIRLRERVGITIRR